MFNIVLYQPEIPPNTGNIMRLCVNTGCVLHLIEPLGFDLNDKNLKRAQLDYEANIKPKIHSSFERFISIEKPKRLFLCTTKASKVYSTFTFQAEDYFIFGPETRGLPTELLNAYPNEQKLRIPMQPSARSLNLANAVAIVVYEAWRQQHFLIE